MTGIVDGFDLTAHVGMPRSGAVLRRALSRLRPQLRTHGIAYVGGPDLDHLPHADWDTRADGQTDAARDFRREVRAALAEERRWAAGALGRHTPHTLISSDRLLGARRLGLRDGQQFRPDAERALGQAIRSAGSRRVRVVLYTQRQDRLLEDAYLQWLRVGAHAELDELFPYALEPVLDYAALAARLESVPNVAEVAVSPFETVTAGTRAFVEDFSRWVGLRGRLDTYAIGADVVAHARQYSAHGVALARAMNQHLDTVDEIESVRDFLTRSFACGEPHVTEILDRATRRRLLENYRETNHALFSRYLPELPVDSYDDDVTTFALGNVLPQPVDRPEPRPAEEASMLVTRAAVTADLSVRRLLRAVCRRSRATVREPR